MKTNKLILVFSFLCISNYLIGQALDLHNNLRLDAKIHASNLKAKSDTIRKAEHIKALIKASNNRQKQYKELRYFNAIATHYTETDTNAIKDAANKFIKNNPVPTPSSDTTAPWSGGGLSNFTVPLFPGATVVPDIKIMADFTIDPDTNGSAFGAKLYGFQKIEDNNIKNEAINMLITEPSYLGVNVYYSTIYFKKNIKLGLNINVDYSARNISVSSKDSTQSKSISPSALILRIGPELILYNNFSIYTNWTANWLLTGIDSYKSYFNRTTTDLFYVNVGIRFIANVFNSSNNSKDNPKIHIDLGAIITSAGIRNFTGNNDKAIVMIRLAYILPVNTKK